MMRPRSSNCASWTTSLLFSLSVLINFINAQQATILNPAQVPACALQCPILLAAQEQCVPPYRQTTNQATYNACFCASDYLTAFRNGQTTGFCDGICTQQEMQTLLVWFRGTVCLSQANPAGTTTTAAATAATARPSTTVINGQTTTIGAAAATGSAGVQRINSGRGPSWIAVNYRWVIMVVVLIVAAILAIILGCWWKKRRDRRRKNDPNHRNSMTVANEVAASFGNKHPVASTTSMSQTTPYVERSTSSVPNIANQQRTSFGSRPTTANNQWQGGAAGVGAAGVGGAAAAATAAMQRSGVNRHPSGSSIGRLQQQQQQQLGSMSDFSPISTPDFADRNNPTPSSISDRPLLAASPAHSNVSPPPIPAASAPQQQSRQTGPSRLQKSNSRGRSSGGGGGGGSHIDYV